MKGGKRKEKRKYGHAEKWAGPSKTAGVQDDLLKPLSSLRSCGGVVREHTNRKNIITKTMVTELAHSVTDEQPNPHTATELDFCPPNEQTYIKFARVVPYFQTEHT